MKDILKPTVFLASCALIASLLLSGIFALTKDRIAELEKEKEQSALAFVLPGFKISDSAYLDSNDPSTKYWIAEKISNGKIIKGFAFISESSGYSGTIKCMIGVDSACKIYGISILTQTETPGLGARSEEVASKNTFLDVLTGTSVEENDVTPWFQKQFSTLNGAKTIVILKRGDWNEAIASELADANAITAITGATITSRAVIKSVKNGIQDFKSIIKE